MIALKQEDFERIFREHLKVETYSMSLETMLGNRFRNKLNYSPYYQRNYVWDNNKATYFIESILLGTEIPPLVFFNNKDNTEVIDGRQRFETILRFVQNKFALTPAGLTSLSQLKRLTYEDLNNKDRSIIDLFSETNIRVIEFAIINNAPLPRQVEDKIKKEIFSRYNSGITPLKKAEVENAVYDDDAISNAFKNKLRSDRELQQLIYTTFFKPKEKLLQHPPIANLLDFIRRFLVLPRFPINYYAGGTNRTEILTRLYEYLSDSTENEDLLIEKFLQKVKFVAMVKKNSGAKMHRHNRLVFECLIWALSVLEMEEVTVDYNNPKFIEELSVFFSDNIDSYTDQDYHFANEIIKRYATTARFFENKYRLNLGIYLSGSPQNRGHIKMVRKEGDALSKLGELATMRLNKPEPSRKVIDDICRLMIKRRFLVRPSYQRQEVIKPSKASLIIESILLGISLPPIFVFKRNDDICEVIDGQQRILTILGFIGSEYMDENNNVTYSKNHKFPLRKLRVLKELEGKTFDDLTDELKNKIYDFPLYVVEIEENKNPNFDPIDLFIRLNDKSYAIREHSFEMWNSWVEYDIIEKVKELTERHNPWFFLRQFKKNYDRDRMENEELFISLVFLEHYWKGNDAAKKAFDIYQKSDRINARIGDKKYITNLLNEVSEVESTRKEFSEAIRKIEAFIRKVKFILLDTDKALHELPDYLRSELEEIFKGGKEIKYFRRTMQDFYILWYLINDLNFEMVKQHRLTMKKEIRDIFFYCKNIPPDEAKDNMGFERFRRKVVHFKARYERDERRLRLSEGDKLDLIKAQSNQSPLSGAPIFLGDEIESDHMIPLALGGKDVMENLQLVHKDENRAKGARIPQHLE